MSKKKTLLTSGKYAFQADAVRSIMTSFRHSKYVCFLGTCGIGKAHIIGLVAEAMIKKGARVLVIAGHQNDLKHQLTERLVSYEHFNENEAVIVGSGGVAVKKINRKSKVLVTIPNAIYRKGAMSRIGKIDYIIIDEAHINAGVESDDGMVPSILKKFPKAKVLLLTATGYSLIRGDRFNYKNKNVKVIADYDHPYAVKKKLVHPIEIHVQKFNFDIPANARDAEGELTLIGRRALRKAFRSETVIKDVLSTILKSESAGKSLIVVPPGDELYLDVVNFLNEKKQGAAVFRHSHAGDGHNFVADQSFKNDPRVKFCVVVYKNAVGWDFPELDNVIDLTLTQNTDLITQRAFRGCRISKIKPKKKPKYIYFTPSGESEETAIHVLTWAHWRMSKNGLLADHTMVPDDEDLYAGMSRRLRETGELVINHKDIRKIELAALKTVKKTLKKGDSHHALTSDFAGKWRYAPIVGGENRALEALRCWYAAVFFPKWESRLNAYMRPLYMKDKSAYDLASSTIVENVRSILKGQPSITSALRKKLDASMQEFLSTPVNLWKSKKAA